MEGASNEQDPEKKKELEEFLKSQELLGGDIMVRKTGIYPRRNDKHPHG